MIRISSATVFTFPYNHVMDILPGQHSDSTIAPGVDLEHCTSRTMPNSSLECLRMTDQTHVHRRRKWGKQPILVALHTSDYHECVTSIGGTINPEAAHSTSHSNTMASIAQYKQLEAVGSYRGVCPHGRQLYHIAYHISLAIHCASCNAGCPMHLSTIFLNSLSICTVPHGSIVFVCWCYALDTIHRTYQDHTTVTYFPCKLTQDSMRHTEHPCDHPHYGE